jgi:hypothetical protein
VWPFSPGRHEPSQAGAVPRHVHWTYSKHVFDLVNLLPGHTTHWPLVSSKRSPASQTHLSPFLIVPPVHSTQFSPADTLFPGHLQLGGVPTLPPVHFGRSLHALAPASQSCPAGQEQLGGMPIVLAGHGS